LSLQVSISEACKLNSVDPQAYLTATLTAIVNGHRQRRIDELLPRNYSGRTNGCSPLSALAAIRPQGEIALKCRQQKEMVND